MMLKPLYICFLFLFFAQSAEAQHRSCNAHTNTRYVQSPAYMIANRRFNAAKPIARGRSKECLEMFTIPLVVHFSEVTELELACLESITLKQIEGLNRDFQGENKDIANWYNTDSSLFTGINAANVCVEFKLATRNHPKGYGLKEGSPAITINQTEKDLNQDFKGYLNIFIHNTGDYLGYSPLGGIGEGDGVVINQSAFGIGFQCGGFNDTRDFNLGRTLTHEVGHYFNLHHTFEFGCAFDGDEVEDTPLAAAPTFGCDKMIIHSCATPNLTMNYMDYTNDACMYMFTGGQVSRMERWANANFQVFREKAKLVLPLQDTLVTVIDTPIIELDTIILDTTETDDITEDDVEEINIPQASIWTYLILGLIILFFSGRKLFFNR